MEEERQWIIKILAGDTACFSCFVTKYQHMAYMIAYRILENREEAEEVVQDSFVKMYRALPDFQFGSKFSTWFYKIIYHTALTARRRQSVFIDYEEVQPEQVSEEEVNSASRALEREDRKEIIARVLKELPSDESLLLTLFYLEECSIEEIHQITDFMVSNIKVKLFRARKHFYEKLKFLMKQEMEEIL